MPYVVNLLAVIFGDQRIKSFRLKGQRNTGIKNCVQPRLQYCAKVMQTNLTKFLAFRRNFAWNDISKKFLRIFVTPIVLIRAIFQMIIHFARWFTPNFWAIIRSCQKVTAIFRTIIRSSRKSDLLFINRPRVFLKYSSLTEIPKWPFKLLGMKEAINLLSSILARRNVSYETHLVISQATLNCWLEPKHQNITVPINKCTCS